MSNTWGLHAGANRPPEPQRLAGAAAGIVVPAGLGQSVQRVPPLGVGVVVGSDGRTHHKAFALPHLLRQVLDVLTQGLALLDADGLVLYANSAAAQACGGQTGLRLGLGQVADAAGADGKRLAKAIEQGVRGRWSMLILGGDGAAARHGQFDDLTDPVTTLNSPGPARRVLGLVPLTPDPACPQARLLLVIGGEPGASALALQFFCQQFGVTQAEHQVLQALGRGLKPADIARDKGVKLSTVRTHVASLRQKAEVPDIGQLLRVLLSLPPVTQPLRQCGG